MQWHAGNTQTQAARVVVGRAAARHSASILRGWEDAGPAAAWDYQKFLASALYAASQGKLFQDSSLCADTVPTEEEAEDNGDDTADLLEADDFVTSGSPVDNIPTMLDDVVDVLLSAANGTRSTDATDGDSAESDSDDDYVARAPKIAKRVAGDLVGGAVGGPQGKRNRAGWIWERARRK